MNAHVAPPDRAVARAAGTRLVADSAAIAMLAFAVRALHAFFLSRTPFFAGPIIDAYAYRRFAEQIANSGEFGGAFYQPPLYPAFLAALFSAGLRSPWAIALVQSLIGALTAVLMLLIGRLLAADGTRARAVGLASGAIAAVYGPFVLFDLELLPPVIVQPLLAVAWLLALRPARAGIADAALGLTLGLAVVGFSLCALFVPGVLALRGRRLRGVRARGTAFALALVLAAVPIALTARHNAANGGEGVLVSFNTGINLWLGNNPRWRETWRARPGARFEPELERPDREGVTRPAERSAYFTRLALRDAAARPWDALARTAEKLYYVFHGREIRRNQDIETLRETSPVLRALLWEGGMFFPFGVIAPLALLGLARRRREADVRIVGCTALLYALGVALFFVAGRYRLPLVLLLIPFAADQSLHAWHHWRERRSVQAVPLLALASCAALLNWPNAFTAGFRADAAERGILAAQAMRNQGQRARAEPISARLVERFPDDSNVRVLRAELLIDAGDCAQAVPQLQRAIELAPRAATPRVMLGTCHDDLGDPVAAERAFAGALSLHPYHPLALRRAGELYARHGRRVEARALLERFERSGYRDPNVAGLLERLEPSRSW
jgi:tetratricopeptide (TPR) repeat protein